MVCAADLIAIHATFTPPPPFTTARELLMINNHARPTGGVTLVKGRELREQKIIEKNKNKQKHESPLFV